MRGAYSRGAPFANDNRILKNLPALLASLIAGVFSALPALFQRAETIRAVGAGTISESASWRDRLASLAFQLGGWGLVDAAGLVLGIIPWLVVFLLLFQGAARLGGITRKFALSLVWMVCLFVSATGIWKTVSSARYRILDMRLLAPVALVESAKKQQDRVFVNVSARPSVAACENRLIDRSLSEEQVAELSASPQKWRAEDRGRPFSAVLLGGTISEAKPLLQHLLESPDWYLARVDNQGLLFLRGESPDLAATAVPEFSGPRERAIYLAQYALQLEAAGFQSLAASSMEEALNLGRKDYDVLYRASSLAAAQNRWESARKLAASAAAVRPGAYEAAYLLACSQLETGAFDKAFEGASKLRRKNPKDPNSLILYARTARAAHDFSEETAALEQLLNLAQQSRANTARIYIYLAQSWAQRGFPDQALTNYQAALAAGLSSGESRDVKASIKTIEANRLKK